MNLKPGQMNGWPYSTFIGVEEIIINKGNIIIDNNGKQINA